MISRRDFVRTGAAAGAAALVPSIGAASPVSRAGSAALRVLILGGTGFVGPHIVNELVSRGHGVAILTRGRREPSLFESAFERVEHLTGDRAQPDGLNALRGRTWDVVIETSGYRHAWTRDAVRALAGATQRYVYISSTGVFWPYHTQDIAENGRILLTDDPPLELPSYGVMKALSENEVTNGFGERALVIRPGYIVGPGDTSDRWTYWPVRIARGGDIMVPGRPSDRVQYIDVRDLTAWLVSMVERGAGGTFNAVGPARPQTMQEFVYGIAATTSVPLTWTWVDDYDWLKNYPLRTLENGATEGLLEAVPWIMVDGDELGHMRIDGRRALAAGLTPRPLADTARDTLQWRQSDQVPAALRERPRYVLTPEQEAALLQAWRAR
jgi:2'-hydroxyisoflavone reductase